MRARKWSGVAEQTACCADCDWASGAKNALPNAKRHAEAHGHTVVCLQQISVTYAAPGMDRDAVSDARGRAWDRHPGY